ncbi:MAG: hypothetical protein PWQ79_886 [Thermococcaceae archaeon]|nr:hypothetical protein [Thermococcaceae archaeon]MDK2913971.1 hypothetical protein [Thermococcaceae archaeon]
MKGKILAGIIIGVLLVVAIIGIMTYSPRERGKTTEDYRGYVVAKLSSLKCYTYSANLSTVSNGQKRESHVEGGYTEGAYFFHGKNPQAEWWAVIENNTLKEKIQKEGGTSDVVLNLTKEELSDVLRYEPVKLAFRALSSSSEVKSGENWVEGNYTFYTTYLGKGAILTGSVKVEFDKGYLPKKLEIRGQITSGKEVLESFELSAELSSSCNVPQWVYELKSLQWN